MFFAKKNSVLYEVKEQLKKMTSFKDLLSHIEDMFKQSEGAKKEVQIQLTSIVSQIFNAAMSNTEGYCYKFSIPLSPVQSLYKKLNLDPIKVEEIFRAEWKYPKNTKMYSDSYYQILLLLFYYGVVSDEKVFMINSMLLIFIKLWNGRRQTFLPYCNPQIMKYVTQTMLSNKYHISKYDSPIQLLSNYFVPSIIKKYAPELKKDSGKLKSIFSQCYSRIYQIFSNQQKVDPETGKKSASGGLATLYYKAYQSGAASRDVKVKADEDGETSFDQYGSSSVVDEIVNSVTDFITLNKQAEYPYEFVKQLNRLTHVRWDVCNTLGVLLHNIKYYDYIHEILILILGILKIREKQDICSSFFLMEIKKKIISSKNTADLKKLNIIMDKFLGELFSRMQKTYNSYSTVQKIQIRVVLIHLIVFNLKKTICHQQVTYQLQDMKKNSYTLDDIFG